MDIQHSHQFVLHGEALLNAFWLPVVIAGSRPKWGAGMIQCTVSARPNNDAEQPLADWIKQGVGLERLHRPIQLRGVISFKEDFWIPQFQVRSFEVDGSGTLKWKGVATTLVEGDLENVDEMSKEIHCSVFIPRTPLTEHMRYGNRKYKEIHWSTASSEMVMKTEMHSLKEVREETRFHIFHTQASQDCIQITCRVSMSLKAFFENLDDILDESLLLLSFLAREQVIWYAAEASCMPTQPNKGWFHANLYRGDISLEKEELSSAQERSLRVNRIDEQAIADGLFHHLFVGYRESPLSHVIRRTIPHLLQSYKKGYFEGRLGSAYLALESLVDGLSEENHISYLLNASQFKKLSKILRKTIQDEIEDENMASGIVNKLTELRRRAFLDRLMILVQKHDLLTWIQQDSPYYVPRYHSLEEVQAAFQNILKRRNTHIHQGKIEDAHHNDLRLLQELIELWILKLLGCPCAAIQTRLYSAFWRHVSER